MKIAPAIAGLLLLAACASSPPARDALEQARAAYRAAQADPLVPLRAGAELEAAAHALADAEHASSAADALHFAYLAEQRAHIARELAQARANDAEVERRRQLALETKLRKTEQERDRALAAAKAAEAARDTSDRLSAEVRRLQAQVAQLEAQQTERGWILTLGTDLLFDSGQAKVKPGGRRAIKNLAQFMRQQPERKIVIEGFTDDRGPAAVNQRLSAQRAQAVRQALVQDGIQPERVEARGRGAAYPVATNSNAQGRQLNRRVEILIGEGPGRAATGGTAQPSGAKR
jgi:outer membrane protein OmpA-like peptidoglycan-associated protein